MKTQYPTVRLRMPFSRGRAVLYEDYMAIEHLHTFGMVSEDSRTYYDEVRWVLGYRKPDWYRAAHAVLCGFPLLVGVLFLALGESWILSTIGVAVALPSGVGLLYALYRFFFVPRAVATVLSSRATVQIGVDWPRSSNPLKDAGKFFETLLSRLKLVEEMPPPVPPPGPAAPPGPIVDAAAAGPIADATPPPPPPAEPAPS